jgi:hypothetical protein
MLPTLLMLLGPRDLVTDGAFDNTANWVEGSNWSVGSGVATCAGNGATNGCLQAVRVALGATYQIDFDIVTVTTPGQGVSAAIGAVAGAIYTTVGHKVDYIVAAAGGSANVGFVARGDGLFAGTLDNLRIKRVS